MVFEFHPYEWDVIFVVWIVHPKSNHRYYCFSSSSSFLGEKSVNLHSDILNFQTFLLKNLESCSYSLPI